MNILTPIMLALFPYLHDTSYNVQVQSCEPNHIVVVSEGVPQEITLFNLKMKDEKRGWEKTCSLLKDANEVSMQIDKSSAVDDPLSVYLFANDSLIQEDLVREDLAYTLIHNPEYTYESKLMEVAQSNRVMAEPKESTTSSYASYGWIFLLTLCIIWSICISYLVYKNRKFIIKNTRQKK